MQAYVPQKWYSKDNTVTSPAVIYMSTRDISVLLVKQRVLLFYHEVTFRKTQQCKRYLLDQTEMLSQRAVLVAPELKRFITFPEAVPACKRYSFHSGVSTGFSFSSFC